MPGKLYGVGVGPGDPELLTLKAVRVIREADVIAVPGETKESSVAYRIARKAVCEIEAKEGLAIHMPMTKDIARLEESHDRGAEEIIHHLKLGKTVAFLTLGDPTIYSTYLYIHKRVCRLYEAEIVSGIPSFCAAAARLNQGLVEREEQLHIIPSSYEVRDAIALPGTKVLMKAGKRIGSVIECLKDVEGAASLVENCGMENEKIYRSVEEMKESAGYYSLIILKEE